MSKHTSHYDPNRDTVGAIYRDAQINNRVEHIDVGDMTNCMMDSMVKDLNEGIEEGLKEFGNREFYITIHEKKDLQMPSCILRRIIKTLYRPWPEDDTLVFRILANGTDVRFCWCLPHVSEMANMLKCSDLFDQTMINQIKAWRDFDLHCFGFVKTGIGDEWIPKLDWEDQKLGIPTYAFSLHVPAPIGSI